MCLYNALKMILTNVLLGTFKERRGANKAAIMSHETEIDKEDMIRKKGRAKKNKENSTQKLQWLLSLIFLA